MISVLLIFLTIGSWSMYESVDKAGTNRIDPFSYGVFKISFEAIMLPFLIYYGIKTNNLNWDSKAFALACVSCLLTTTADFSMLYLLSKNNISWVLSMTTPISLVLGIILGIIIFKESLTITHALGIASIVLGVFLLNR